MVSPLRKILLVQGLLSFTAKAERSMSLIAEDLEDEKIGDLLALSPDVCGGPTIKGLITPKSKSMVRLTPWTKITTIAQNYIASQGSIIDKTNREIVELEKKIEAQKLLEDVGMWEDEAIKQLITKVVTAGFQADMEDIVESHCGFKRIRKTKSGKRPKADGFQTSVASFTSEVAGVFADGKVRTVASKVIEVCEKLLPPGQADDSYCDEMCLEFSEAAQEASGIGAVGEGSAALQQQVAEKRELIRLAMSSQSNCEATLESIVAFKGHLEPLEKAIKDAQAKANEARNKFGEAEDELQGLEDKMEKQEEFLATAVKSMQDAGQDAKDAGDALEKIAKTEDKLKKDLAQTIQQMTEAKAALDDADKADQSAKQLRLLISKVMMSMESFFDEAVREPLRDLSLDMIQEDAGLQSVFAAGSGFNSAKSGFEKSIKALSDYCTKSAIPAWDAFDKVVTDSNTDIRKLCEIGNKDAIVEDTDQLLRTKQEATKTLIKKATAFLHEYHGQEGMTAELEARFVSEGEPQGLRKVIGPFKRHLEGQTNRFQEYLEKWKANDLFLTLLGKLKTKLAEMTKNGVQLDNLINSLTQTLAKTEADRKDATTKLNTLKAKSGVATQVKQQAEDILKGLEADHDQAEIDLAALKKIMDDLHKLYLEAKKTFEREFNENMTPSEKEITKHF